MAQDFPGLPGFPRVSPELALVPQGVSGFPRVPQGSPGCARVLAWFARVRPRFPGLPDFPALFPGFPGLAGSRRVRLAGSALPGSPCRVRLAGSALGPPGWHAPLQTPPRRTRPPPHSPGPLPAPPPPSAPPGRRRRCSAAACGAPAQAVSASCPQLCFHLF